MDLTTSLCDYTTFIQLQIAFLFAGQWIFYIQFEGRRYLLKYIQCDPYII